MNLTYEPLLSWPGALRPAGARTYSPFRAGWSQTLDLLDREAFALTAAGVVLRLAYPPHAFRLDGSLRADYARKAPEHPGVLVALDTRQHGPLSYSTDRFTDWRDNVRAVALGLESLRRVERYGIADEGQQYAGFKALGAGVALGAPAPLTLDEAARILSAALDGLATPERVLAEPGVARHAYRRALQVIHPDVGGSGDGERMARLQEAWTLVRAHHGLD